MNRYERIFETLGWVFVAVWVLVMAVVVAVKTAGGTINAVFEVASLLVMVALILGMIVSGVMFIMGLEDPLF